MLVWLLWIGDPAEIKAKRVERQSFDREDARPLLRLCCEKITFRKFGCRVRRIGMARSPSGYEI